MLKTERISTKVQIKINSKSQSLLTSFKEFWQYRGLLYTFAYRDYRSRFAQTFLGFGWAILQPIITMLVLYILFQRVIKTETHGIGFFAFALSGLMFWNYFSFVVGQASSSLINAQKMLQKIYFPRLVLPLSKGLVGLVEAALALIIFLLFAFRESKFEALGLLAFPVSLLIVLIGAWGIGLWVSALSIRFRDLQQIIPFILQLLFFLTPVAYAPSMIEAYFGNNLWLAYLNPVAGSIEFFRAFSFNITLNPQAYISVFSSLVLFVSGWIYFQKTERKMADLI